MRTSDYYYNSRRRGPRWNTARGGRLSSLARRLRSSPVRTPGRSSSAADPRGAACRGPVIAARRVRKPVSRTPVRGYGNTVCRARNPVDWRARARACTAGTRQTICLLCARQAKHFDLIRFSLPNSYV